MKTFEEYILDWWNKYIPQQDEETLKTLMENVIGEEECIDDYIPSEAKSIEDWLLNKMTANDIYEKYFVYKSNRPSPDNMPECVEFIQDMLMENVTWPDGNDSTKPSFAEEYTYDMAEHIAERDTPFDFFDEITSHGCQSGLIGMLIYNNDCKDIYIRHLDDMEDYKALLDDEYGLIKNQEGLPHYVFMTWLCYEDMAWRLFESLYPGV